MNLIPSPEKIFSNRSICSTMAGNSIPVSQYITSCKGYVTGSLRCRLNHLRPRDVESLPPERDRIKYSGFIFVPPYLHHPFGCHALLFFARCAYVDAVRQHFSNADVVAVAAPLAICVAVVICCCVSSIMVSHTLCRSSSRSTLSHTTAHLSSGVCS